MPLTPATLWITVAGASVGWWIGVDQSTGKADRDIVLGLQRGFLAAGAVAVGHRQPAQRAAGSEDPLKAAARSAKRAASGQRAHNRRNSTAEQAAALKITQLNCESACGSGSMSRTL